ncbi:tRNA (adenosine(37)-N6)-threonylcarbamoyltransferase complex ATPase subunit type 1 TsaE [Candidatus Parcubacteria bacterium]|nr:tRNA (adenosine(37)-N6)-threonylcarbamoyltransferase complex ATPase subunit type 1 TsaE [Candidatus Parcubacteria bacterium]
MKLISKSLAETAAIAEQFVEALQASEQAVVVALDGDLGSGKTAFSQAIGEALGVRDPIQSPTFLIEKIYELHRQPWKHLVHIDAYRLEREGELLSLGWKEIISKPENLILVEWAEKVRNILPESAIHIVFNHVDETTREIEISAA